MVNLKYLILIMFLSKLLHFNFNCNKKPYGAISKSSEALTFQSIMDNCEQLLPKKSKLDGVLILNIKTEDNQINAWDVIARTTNKTNESYHKIEQGKDDQLTIEEVNLPFGYQPFDAIELELDAVYKIASKNKENTICNQYQLYFPLTPFDKEPIWVLTFEDDTTVMVGANTGEIIKPMEY